MKKSYPKGDFFSECLNAPTITPINKTAATVTAVYIARCSYQTSPQKNPYVCVNENNQFIGSRYYEVNGIANCRGKPNAYPCVTVKTVKEVTKPPSPSSPPPVGTWIQTPIIFVPEDVQKAGLDYLINNANIVKAVAPAETGQSTYYGDTHINQGYDFFRKIDTNGGVTYKIPATVVTQSAAKGCPLPVLSSETTVDVKKTAPGKYVYSNMVDKRTGKALKEDSGTQPACVGKAAWKAGVAKVENYCKTIKGGCYKMGTPDKK